MERIDNDARAIEFNREVPREELGAIRITRAQSCSPLPFGAAVRLDQTEGLQLFILGSPRSGTSELADALASRLDLQWRGEGSGSCGVSRI